MVMSLLVNTSRRQVQHIFLSFIQAHQETVFNNSSARLTRSVGCREILTDVSYVRLWMRCTGLDTKEVRTAKVFWWGVMPAHSHGHRM